MKTKDEDYIPFGEQWKDTLRKETKEFIITLYRNVCIKLQDAEEKIKILKKELGRE
jgi:hypothetical protein